jgi:hypothetical protein
VYGHLDTFSYTLYTDIIFFVLCTNIICFILYTNIICFALYKDIIFFILYGNVMRSLYTGVLFHVRLCTDIISYYIRTKYVLYTETCYVLCTNKICCVLYTDIIDILLVYWYLLRIMYKHNFFCFIYENNLFLII